MQLSKAQRIIVKYGESKWATWRSRNLRPLQENLENPKAVEYGRLWECVSCGPALTARSAPRDESKSREVRIQGAHAKPAAARKEFCLWMWDFEGMLSARHESCPRTYFKVRNSAAEKAKEILEGKWATVSSFDFLSCPDPHFHF